MKKLLLALLVLLALGFVGSKAEASAPRITPLGIESVGPVAIIPAASSTALLAWIDTKNIVTLGEWSIAETRILRRATVKSFDGRRTVKLARAGERIVVAVGGVWELSETVEVFTFDKELKPVGSTALGLGASPSLEADAQSVVVAAFEEREPVKAPIVTARVSFAPRHVLHVRVLDPSTLEVKGGRVFTGRELLRPDLVNGRAEHTLALLDGRLFVALPDVQPKIVAVKVPSLATVQEKKLPRAEGPAIAPTSASITRSGSELVVGTTDAVRILGPKLDLRSTIPSKTAFVYYADPASTALLADGETGARMLGAHSVRPLATSSEGDATGAFVFGRAVTIVALPSEDEPFAKGIVVR